MAAVEGDRYAFEVEWLDYNIGNKRKYQFMYYTLDKTIEMYDIKNRRTFLKRCYYPDVSLDKLYVGSKVTVYSRQLEVVAFADEFTRRTLGANEEKTLAVVKPEGFSSLGKILDAFYSVGLRVQRLQINNENETGVELAGTGAVASVVDLISKEEVMSNVYASKSMEDAGGEIESFFSNPAALPLGTGCTCCLIKPHAIQAGLAGKIMTRIQGSYSISAIGLFTLDKDNAAEFYEVYKGVVPEYASMVDDLTSGPFMALEISSLATEEGRSEEEMEVVESFRDLCGPQDPELARVLRPSSLRGQFGLDKVKNAVHCTDLAEDGALEANYFFKVLAA